MFCLRWEAENLQPGWRPYRQVFCAVETVCEEQQAKGFSHILSHHPPLLVQEPFPDVCSQLGNFWNVTGTTNNFTRREFIVNRIHKTHRLG